MYTVKLHPNHAQNFPKRKEAVRAARRMSENRRNPVKVLRDDGWERLIYKEGSLLEGTLVTRDRRSPGRRLE